MILLSYLTITVFPSLISSYVSMLHLYESFGWFRAVELRKVHSAEGMFIDFNYQGSHGEEHTSLRLAKRRPQPTYLSHMISMSRVSLHLDFTSFRFYFHSYRLE